MHTPEDYDFAFFAPTRDSYAFKFLGAAPFKDFLDAKLKTLRDGDKKHVTFYFLATPKGVVAPKPVWVTHYLPIVEISYFSNVRVGEEPTLVQCPIFHVTVSLKVRDDSDEDYVKDEFITDTETSSKAIGKSVWRAYLAAEKKTAEVK